MVSNGHPTDRRAQTRWYIYETECLDLAHAPIDARKKLHTEFTKHLHYLTNFGVNKCCADVSTIFAQNLPNRRRQEQTTVGTWCVLIWRLGPSVFATEHSIGCTLHKLKIDTSKGRSLPLICHNTNAVGGGGGGGGGRGSERKEEKGEVGCWRGGGGCK